MRKKAHVLAPSMHHYVCRSCGQISKDWLYLVRHSCGHCDKANLVQVKL